MNGYPAGLLSIEQATGMFLAPGKETGHANVKTDESPISFQKIFEDKTKLSQEVKFSKHANERLESRHIELSNMQITRLNEGVNRARDKRINESLVMMDDLAFIVNVKNNTVITAFGSGDDSVFTNIDGAVIV